MPAQDFPLTIFLADEIVANEGTLAGVFGGIDCQVDADRPVALQGGLVDDDAVMLGVGIAIGECSV